MDAQFRDKMVNIVESQRANAVRELTEQATAYADRAVAIVHPDNLTIYPLTELERKRSNDECSNAHLYFFASALVMILTVSSTLFLSSFATSTTGLVAGVLGWSCALASALCMLRAGFFMSSAARHRAELRSNGYSSVSEHVFKHFARMVWLIGEKGVYVPSAGDRVGQRAAPPADALCFSEMSEPIVTERGSTTTLTLSNREGSQIRSLVVLSSDYLMIEAAQRTIGARIILPRITDLQDGQRQQIFE